MTAAIRGISPIKRKLILAFTGWVLIRRVIAFVGAMGFFKSPDLIRLTICQQFKCLIDVCGGGHIDCYELVRSALISATQFL